MSHVFIVMGETGEYSDHTDWPVLAYHTEAHAQAHVLRCDAWLREHHLAMGDPAPLGVYRSGSLTNPHDPQFMSDYTGTRYYVISVPLGETTT